MKNKVPCHRCKKNKKADKLKQIDEFLYCGDCVIIMSASNPECPDCNKFMHGVGAVQGQQRYQCTNLQCNNFKTYSESGEELGFRPTNIQ